jgi:hypothetical protein
MFDLEGGCSGGAPHRRYTVIAIIVLVFVIPAMGGYGSLTTGATIDLGSIFHFFITWIVPGWIVWAILGYVFVQLRRHRNTWRPTLEREIGAALDDAAAWMEPRPCVHEYDAGPHCVRCGAPRAATGATVRLR